MAVITPNFGLVTGRISSLALDPSDSTGNTLYVGTAGGGIWISHNAATTDTTKIKFTPLTDRPGAIAAAEDTSISIGALTVQPGGTGVILAGTGDPNDARDSYYGTGILRSTDSGNSWSLVQGTTDVSTGLGAVEHGFIGEAFAGFAWSTVDPQLVVAAVSQSYGGSLVHAGVAGYSYAGLYYSRNSGATWHLARIVDATGQDVQGPFDVFASAEGNAATAVVWNPIRNLFIAAVRYHGYYQSSDGAAWTRMVSQPGAGLTTAMCPTNTSLIGSPACLIFRGALAVDPLTGDTFAWTVDRNNQDQGLWQDTCKFRAGACSDPAVSFATQLPTADLEASTLAGPATILNGDYNLALSAIPWNQDTLLFAGAEDLWKCSLAAGCLWRNTTNSTTCMSARVGEHQHAITWNPANPLEVLVGNDSGLWRSEDAVAETGSACSASDADHWQNLNSALGSLAEVVSMSQVGSSPYTLMAGLGANGTAGVKSTTGVTQNWPQILGGAGGPVAVDPTDPNNWYVNNGPGVSIHLCSTAVACRPSDFGELPVVSNTDTGNDGLYMTDPAPFLVDPLDANQLLIATCRLWRGPASPNSWTGANAVTPMLGSGSSPSSCSGNPLIRSVAAEALPAGGEVVYAGTFQSANGGGNLAGRVLKASMNSSGAWSGWTDLTFNPVVNDPFRFNPYGFQVSSIAVDPHDTTGDTVYVTIAGMPDHAIGLAYESVDGGKHWRDITSNLQLAPVNTVQIDPADPNTVYLATDVGVFATQQVATCDDPGVNCWFAFGAGLPESPVTALSASPTAASPNVLVAGTYGRGIWQIPLLTAGVQMTTATAMPTSLTFDAQPEGSSSSPQSVTVTNTSAFALLPTSISATGDFAETDNCLGASINAGANCTITATFSPTRTGTRTGQLTIQGNISTGNIVIDLSGTGVAPPVINLQPASNDFGSVEVATKSAGEQITVENSGAVAVPITRITLSPPFVVAANSCGTTSLAPSSDCQITIEFDPTAVGTATGTLTLVDSAGTQTVQLSGTGTAPPTDTLSSVSLTFPGTIIGATSTAKAITLTNSGGNPLTSIDITVSGAFQQSNNCTTQLAGGGYCSITVVYAPSAAGVQNGSLVMADLRRTQTVSLQGTGLLPPVFSVNPGSLNFGVQQVNVASPALSLTITNSGGASMANIGFQITGSSAPAFATGATTCGAALASGSSCTAQVTFTPTASGVAQAALTISSSTAQVKPLPVPLSGTGRSTSGLNAAPATLTFSATALGQTSTAKTVTITNSGKVAASALAVAASGPFAVVENTCGSTLAAGASCSTGVVFSPMQTGNLTGILTVSSDSVNPPATVPLAGVGGLSGALQAQPAQLEFPTTGVGSASDPKTVTLRNVSTSAPLDGFALTASTGFRVASTTCGSSLPAGATCTADVVFMPASAGAATGTLAISSTGMASNAAVPLTGTGFDFTPAVTGSASQTVASGQTASYSLTLSSAGGSSGTLTFQCSSLPQFAACAFNPPSLTVTATATVTEAIRITTSEASPAISGRHSFPAAVPITLACGLLFLPFAIRRRGVRLLVFLSVFIAGITSCAGSGGGGGGTVPQSPSARSTAPGTYSIPLVISANGVQHTVTLTLVVD